MCLFLNVCSTNVKMLLLFYLIVLTCAPEGRGEDEVVCIKNGTRVEDPSNRFRFLECQNSSWVVLNCANDYIFDGNVSICVKIESTSFPQNESGDVDTFETTTAEDISTTNITPYYDGDNETSAEIGPVVKKTISNDSPSKVDQILEKPVHWMPFPALNKKSMKTKANWTTNVVNGVAVYTDISFYQSHGQSYQFRVPGGLPAEQNQVISWIRENGYKYPHIDIPYPQDEEKIIVGDTFPNGLPTRCGTKFRDKLSGGKPTPIEDNPWQVAVLRNFDSIYVCGGAVITRNHVISAAHCFRHRKRSYMSEDIILRVGDYDKEVREESQIDYSVSQIIIHEDYQEKKHLHDIAILATSDRILFSSHIYPICLPGTDAIYEAGHKCTVSGWGQVEAESIPTRYLRSGEVTIISKEECRRKTIFSRGVPVQIFCAEDPTKSGVDTCLGDSGGPFACNYNGIFYLVGITAFGSYPCGQDIPSFYTNVSHYRQWTLDQIKPIS